jgi:transcriptional regulator with XRE-family HTH domain
MKNILSANIRRLRKEKKMSQNALAERASLSFRGLQDIEYEVTWPEWANVMAISAALGVPHTELFRDFDAEAKPTDEQVIARIVEKFAEKPALSAVPDPVISLASLEKDELASIKNMLRTFKSGNARKLLDFMEGKKDEA